jgi:hypothetical protein
LFDDLPDQSLRIPGDRRFMYVMTFEFLQEIHVDRLAVCHPAELLGEECLPGNIADYRLRLNRLQSAKVRWSHIEEAEAAILPIQNGQSNQQFLQLCLVYRTAGLERSKHINNFDGYYSALLPTLASWRRIINGCASRYYAKITWQSISPPI